VPNNCLMASLPRPLIGLLVAAIAFFAIWTVALKPSSSSGGSTSSPSPNIAASAIAKAHQASTASDRASAADGAPVSSATQASPTPATHTTPASRTAPGTHTAPATHTLPATHTAPATHAAAPKRHVAKPATSSAPSAASVMGAIAAHKTVALLFFNPSAPDDNAVKRELAAIPSGNRELAKFAVPESQLAQYNRVTAGVPVNATPTLILIDKHGKATSLVGFADQLEIAQRISDALGVK
jgi:cytoskeletal protein RodZ